MKNLIFYFFIAILLGSCADDSAGSFSETNGSSTLSGSYANMITAGDFLYVVSEDMLITYSIIKADQPEEIDRQTLAFGVESLFYRAGILFVGSSQSMYIYMINEVGIPELRSETPYANFEDITPCDPIVANDTLAIASLSSLLVPDENGCGSAEVNELRFFDITDIEQPVLYHTIEMEQPKGLGLDGEILFVCEAENGLKIYNIKDAVNAELLYHFDGFKTFDIIATGTLALVVGPDKLYEFDYSDLTDVRLRSTIAL